MKNTMEIAEQNKAQISSGNINLVALCSATKALGDMV